MEDFAKKVTIGEGSDADEEPGRCNSTASSSAIVHLLRNFLTIQQRRAEAYGKLKRYSQSPKAPLFHPQFQFFFFF